MNNWVVAYATWIVRWRWPVVLLSVAATLALASGDRFIQFSNDYRYFFTDENPNLVAFEQLERTYTSPDTLLWVLQPKEGLATDPRVLGIVKKITEAAWQTPYSVRVDSITNYQYTSALKDDLTVRDLVIDPASLDAAGAEEVRRIATSEPAIARRLIADDARTTAIMATLKLPRGDIAAVAASVSHARAIMADIRKNNPDIHIELTGSSMLSNAFSEAAQRDLRTLTPIMYGILTLTVFLLLRSITATIATLTLVGLSAAAAVGLTMGWLGVPLTPPSSGAPTIILTIAVADSIHILVSMLVEMHKGRDQKAAIIEAMRVNWQPVFLTSVTTAIGFLSLNFSDAPPFRDLGNTAAVGAMVAWFLSVTFLPAFVSLVPVKAHAGLARQGRAMERIAEFVIRYRRPVMAVMILMIIGFAVPLPSLVFNDRSIKYFDTSLEVRTATDWAAENLTGIEQIAHSVPAGESGGIANPEYLKRLDAFANWYREQPHVIHVATFTDVMKRVNKSMNGDREEFYRLPDDREMAAQYLLLYEMSLPYGLDLNDQVNVDKSATKMTVTLDDISTMQLSALRDHADAWLKKNMPEDFFSRSAGRTVMFSFIGRNNFYSMIFGTALALVLISGCLMLALRNLRLGFISLVPNLAPPIMAFGIFGLFTHDIGLWASFVIPTALGLIVDATVHFLSKYQRARRERNLSPEDSIRFAFSTVGTALWVASLVLIVGFAILAFSPFKVNAMMGLIVAITIASALVLDFLLLPTLLLLLDRRKGDAPASSSGAPRLATAERS